MIITTITLFVLTVIFIIATIMCDDCSGLQFICACIGLVLGFCFIVSGICTWTAPYDYQSKIASFNATKETVKEQRLSAKTDYERVQLTQEIIAQNQWLAQTKYSKTTIWGDVIPNEINELTPIK
jgi:hypothetical protein